ncbi:MULTISPECIES: hypothetical protein [Methylorubrum]|uniref:Uncharacterized protein n=1 Tax=Methylorubrum suomiense TaxID=144191 RepID=A0ABQ4V198_9HYPH|nr:MULTISPECIES: hypothetical protein [Methylobacteriaceae]GJE77834.1 hypothetical protein BGCPKDLD_4441 [Methylorubrum suomiense]
MSLKIVAGAALGLVLSTTAFAQSYNAPSGIPAATAPGGLEGIAGPGNVQRYVDRYGRPGPASVDGVYATGSIVHAPRADRSR